MRISNAPTMERRMTYAEMRDLIEKAKAKGLISTPSPEPVFESVKGRKPWAIAKSRVLAKPIVP